MAQGVTLDDPDISDRVAKSDTLQKIEFEASVERGIQAVFRKNEDYVIWGPASVEIVDKEGDKISVDALDKALPQLLKRARLSLEHTDQIVGRILERFQTADPVTVEINGHQYERKEFPTDVLDLDDGDPPALFVAGEVFNDTQQSQRARERIEAGELTSYSISGEALVTEKKVDGDTVYDDILDIDLSAVTLCEKGMNQGAAYARVDGELDDKELAGEAAETAKRQEIPVLQTPSVSGVSGDQADAVSKQMTEQDQEDEAPQEEKSDGPDLNDVLKRLPEEGEIATKDDVEDAAEKAVQDTLPNGDLATTGYMEQFVRSEVTDRMARIQASEDLNYKHLAGFVSDLLDKDTEEAEEFLVESVDEKTAVKMWQDLNATRKAANEADDFEEFEETFKQYGPEDRDVDAPGHDGDYGPEGSGDSPADSQSEEAGDVDQGGDGSPNAPDAGQQTSGSRSPDQGNETQDLSGVDTTSAKQKGDLTLAAARDKIADEMGVDTKEVNDALNRFLTREGDEDEDEEFDPEEEDDVEVGDDEEEDVEIEMGEEDEEFDDPEDPDDPEDLEEVPNPNDDEEEAEGDEITLADLKRELPEDVYETVERYVDAKSDDETVDKSNLTEEVNNIVTRGAEVQGGTAIPTDDEDDTVDKQYSKQDDGEGLETDEGGSPALQNFYE